MRLFWGFILAVAIAWLPCQPWVNAESTPADASVCAQCACCVKPIPATTTAHPTSGLPVQTSIGVLWIPLQGWNVVDPERESFWWGNRFSMNSASPPGSLRPLFQRHCLYLL